MRHSLHVHTVLWCCPHSPLPLLPSSHRPLPLSDLFLPIRLCVTLSPAPVPSSFKAVLLGFLMQHGWEVMSRNLDTLPVATVLKMHLLPQQPLPAVNPQGGVESVNPGLSPWQDAHSSIVYTYLVQAILVFDHFFLFSNFISCSSFRFVCFLDLFV